MRKWIGVVAVLALLISGVFTWNHFKGRHVSSVKTTVYSKLLSEKPLWFFELNNAGEVWDRLKKTNFYKQIPDKQFIQRLRSTPQWKTMQASLEEVKKNLGVPVNEETLKAVLGEDVAIAIFAPETMQQKTPIRKVSTSANRGIDKMNFPDFALFFRLGNKAKPSELLLEINKWVNENSSYEAKPYKKHTVYKFPLKNEWYKQMYLAFVKDSMILCSKEEILSRIVDRSDTTGKVFSTMLRRIPEKSLFSCYVNNSLYQKWINGILQNIENINQRGVERKWQELGGGVSEEAICYGKLDKDLEIIAESTVSSGKSVVKEIICRAPVKDEPVRFVPENGILYWWTNCLDLPKIKAAIDELAKSNKSFAKNYDDFVENFEKKYQLDLNKLFSALGPEAALVLLPPGPASPLTMPGVLVIMKVKDSEWVKETIVRLTKKPTQENSGLPMVFGWKEIKAGEYTLNYIPTPIGLTPGYFILDSYLIIGMRLEDFQTTMNLASGNKKDSLETAMDFQQTIPNIKRNSTFYLNTRLLAATIKEIMERFPTIKNRWPEGDKEDFISMLDTVQVIQGIGFVSLWEKPYLKCSYKVDMKDLPPEEKVESQTSQR